MDILVEDQTQDVHKKNELWNIADAFLFVLEFSLLVMIKTYFFDSFTFLIHDQVAHHCPFERLIKVEDPQPKLKKYHNLLYPK